MDAEVQVELPRLIGGRHRIDQLLDVHGSMAGKRVVVSARGLRTGSSSAADQLVLRTLVDGHAVSLEVHGAPQRFVNYLEEAAVARGVETRLRVATPA